MRAATLSPSPEGSRRAPSVSKQRTSRWWVGRVDAVRATPVPTLICQRREHQIALTECPVPAAQGTRAMQSANGYRSSKRRTACARSSRVRPAAPEPIGFGAEFRRVAAGEHEGRQCRVARSRDTLNPALRKSLCAQPAEVHLPLHCGKPMRRRRSLNRASDRSGSQAGRNRMDGLNRASLAFSN